MHYSSLSCGGVAASYGRMGSGFTQGELMFDDIDLLVMLHLVRGWSPIRWEIFCLHPLPARPEPATGLTFNSLPDGLSYLLIRLTPG